MKKIILFFALISIVFCGTGDVRVDLIQGYFSGSIDINGHVAELDDGALFSGQFVYDTDAAPSYNWIAGDETHTALTGSFIELSVALVGIHDTYTYADNNSHGEPSTSLTYCNNGVGDYTLDFDGMKSATDFIEELDVFNPELILEFSNTSGLDPNYPVIMPNADNFIPGTSYYGSVLYLWVLDNEGVNSGNAQINCNITSLSLQSYPQPIPEPTTAVLVGTGLAFFTAYRRKRKFFATEL